MTNDLTINAYDFWPTLDEPEYGLLYCEDGEGKHWTLRGDVALVEKARDANVRNVSHEPLASADWERREGWPDEWADDETSLVTNSNGEFIAMRDDGLLVRPVKSKADLETGWHLMTEPEYEAMIAFVGESNVDPAHRRA